MYLKYVVVFLLEYSWYLYIIVVWLYGDMIKKNDTTLNYTYGKHRPLMYNKNVY